jgi:hypothetical protein
MDTDLVPIEEAKKWVELQRGKNPVGRAETFRVVDALQKRIDVHEQEKSR